MTQIEMGIKMVDCPKCGKPGKPTGKEFAFGVFNGKRISAHPAARNTMHSTGMENSTTLYQKQNNNGLTPPLFYFKIKKHLLFHIVHISVSLPEVGNQSHVEDKTTTGRPLRM